MWSPPWKDLLVVLLAVREEVLAVCLCGGDVQGGVHPSSAARQRPLQAGAVLLQAAPQLVVETQQLGILSFERLLQEGRGWRGEGAVRKHFIMCHIKRVLQPGDNFSWRIESNQTAPAISLINRASLYYIRGMELSWSPPLMGRSHIFNNSLLMQMLVKMILSLGYRNKLFHFLKIYISASIEQSHHSYSQILLII